MKRKKINTIAGAVKQAYIIRDCKHEFGKLQTDKSTSSVAGFQYRTCSKCGLRDFTSEVVNRIKENLLK